MTSNVVLFFTCPVSNERYTVTIMEVCGNKVRINGRAHYGTGWFTNRWVELRDIEEVDMGNYNCCDTQRYI